MIYEDQFDGEWDRGWHKFTDMFPDVDLTKYTRIEALKILLQRFVYRHVCFDIKMARSFYKLPEKDIKAAVAALVDDGVLAEYDGGYMLPDDIAMLDSYDGEPPKSVFAMHRNDILVKSNEHWLKERYTHTYPDTLYYMLIDGEFRGAVVGKFRYTPEVEDVILDLPQVEAATRKDDILQAVQMLCGANVPIKRYQGEEFQ